MDSINLLEELNLNDYYPQKLSFGAAITLREQSPQGSHKHCGLEIVRRLLMFDYTAVVLVTTEMNKRPNSTGNKETETKDQGVSGGVRSTLKTAARTSRRRKLHPMDLLVVVMNCCDDFLRQILVEKMFINKLSIPILLPDIINGSHTLMLLALRSLIPEVPDRIRDGSTSLTDTLVDVRNPVVSFLRVGNLHRSKSKLMNELLNFTSFNTFFHRDCTNGSANRSVSDGSIEATWFQSSTVTEEEFNCKFFTALNLRGNARDYSKQTQFLCESSTLTVFMVDSFKSFKDLHENVLKKVDLSKTKIIVCLISCESFYKPDKTNLDLWNDGFGHGVISEVICDWIDDEKLNDVDFTSDLREIISRCLNPEHGQLVQMPTYADISRSKQDFWFQLDEDKLEYRMEKTSAEQFIDSVFNLSSDCRTTMLPLQGKPWEQFGKLEREQRRTSQNKSNDEHYISQMEIEKRRQRELQCHYLFQQHDITSKFSLKFYSLQDQTLLYYLNCCKNKLDARSRVIMSKIIEECKQGRQENHPHRSNEDEHEMKLNKVQLKISNSAIGLEHILREHGQMYEAVDLIWEEIRMREKLENATFTPDAIRNFPTIVARLLVRGQPLELMDGDASNVPITWLKAVLEQVGLMTNNAKVFVISIIGVQSSGKSTLLNALFGLQFPVSAGRCTRGIYCHLVPVDKESLHTEYDYVLVVDTEGLGASEFTGKSTFKDNELATFAFGLADATIINIKGENWADMTDILQIVAHGLIRVRKTKTQLDLMPRCMFVHQNVPAADAEEKNWLGQETQLEHLDKAIKIAGSAEGFPELTKFNQVIKYDPKSHSWYFPDLLSGSPPKARISQDYTRKANELRQYLVQLMKDHNSKLTISGFFRRMSDLWHAMLHDDFVFSFRNTHDIILSMVLNDNISHEVDSYKRLNKLEQRKIRELICSFDSIETFRTKEERILTDMNREIEKNFTNMEATLQVIIDASNICEDLKQQHDVSLSKIKEGELLRISEEMKKEIVIHMKKLEYCNDQGVKELNDRLFDLENSIEDVERNKLNETEGEFEIKWQQLLSDSKLLVNDRIKPVESEIKETIRTSIKQFEREDKWPLETVVWSELFHTPFTDNMPQVIEKDILKKHVPRKPAGLVMDFLKSKSYVDEANSILNRAYKRWELQFQNKRGLEFDPAHLKQIFFEVGQLLGLSKKGACELPSATNSTSFKSTCETDGADEMWSSMPQGYSFTSAYSTGLIRFVCSYIYNRSFENSRIFISMTDPLADIDERYHRSVSHYRQVTAEANIDAVGEQIFDCAKRSFVRDLGELIKAEVCKTDTKYTTFKSKRAFLRTIITGLAQETVGLTVVRDKKRAIFKKFMFYIKMAETEKSEKFFHNAIMKLLQDVLTSGCESESQTDFQKMVESNFEMIIKGAINALQHAEANAKGCSQEYIRIFKGYNNETSKIDFRITNLSGFTEAVVEKLNNFYAGFLKQANVSFATLVCEGDNAAIRTVLEKIMGCRERCPFCSAPCSESLDKHPGDHRANHYPMGVRGTVDCWGLFRNTQETPDASEEDKRKPRKLALSTCQAMVGTSVDIRTVVTVSKATKWYHRNYHPFKRFKELDEYKDWDIPYSRDHNASLYWKWFMAQFGKELAEHYKALCPDIPEAWNKVTLKQAINSLEELDLNSF